MTGTQYLNFISDIFGIETEIRRSKIERFAKEFGLFRALSQPISSYSHGMKQKLAMISALDP